MKRVINVFLILIVFVTIFVLLNILVQPKYKEELIEGSLISDYYKSSFDHDVIFLGDCEIYANFSPLEMYEEKNIKAFNRATSQQMVWQSFHILKETLKYETPKLVVFSVGGLRNGEEKINEAYNRLTIDNMRLSQDKIDIINVSKTENESYLSYIFPILRYHSRIGELTKEDFNYYLSKADVSYNGFIINKDTKPLGNLPIKRKLKNYKFEDKVIKYLDLITLLCKENNIELLLVKAPSVYPYWYEEYDEFLVDYANLNNIEYLNILDFVEEIGIDFSTDTYDGGLHLNLNGAIKNSKFFANYLYEHYDLDFNKNDYYDNLLTKYIEEKS